MLESLLIVLLAAWMLRIVWLYTCAPSMTVIELYDSDWMDMLTTAELVALLEAEEE